MFSRKPMQYIARFFKTILLKGIPNIMNITRKQTGSGAERYGEWPEAQRPPFTRAPGRPGAPADQSPSKG